MLFFSDQRILLCLPAHHGAPGLTSFQDTKQARCHTKATLLAHHCRAIVTVGDGKCRCNGNCRAMASAEHWQSVSCLMHCAACLLVLAVSGKPWGGRQAAQQSRTAIVVHNGHTSLCCCCQPTMCVIHNETLVKQKGVQAAGCDCRMNQDGYDLTLHEHFILVECTEYSSVSVSTLLSPIQKECLCNTIC